MNIKYMGVLQEHPAKYPNKDLEFRNVPINHPNDPIAGIEDLEREYNNGNQFPLAFREFLFLAGKYCWVRHPQYGPFKKENDVVRDTLSDNSLTISRPFFVFEMGTSNDIFFYLDENKEDPQLYTLGFDENPANPTGNLVLNIKQRDDTLSELINYRVKMFLKMRNSGLYGI